MNQILFGDAGIVLADWLFAIVATIAALGKWWHLYRTRAAQLIAARVMLGIAWTMLAGRMWVPLLQGKDPYVGALALMGLTIMAAGSVLVDLYDIRRK